MRRQPYALSEAAEYGLLKTLVTTDAQGTSVESHSLDYSDLNGYFANGSKTGDTFTLLGPSTSAPCRSSSCTTSYRYNARDQLTRTDDGLGTVTVDTLDPVGNVTAEAVTSGQTTTTTTNTYVGQQLSSTTTAGSTQLFWYDPNGNVKCVTTGAGSASNCGPASGSTASSALLTDYSYDYRDRMASARQFAAGAITDQASYTFDALSRPVEENEQHPAGVTRNSLFSYLGLTNDVTSEQRKDGTGSLLSSNSYSYDANGRKIGMTNTPAGQAASRFTYGYDPHGNIALLLKQAGGAQASYGYEAYGSANSPLTAGDTNTTDPLNPYRYSGKRYDTGSKTIDMGARRFSPATGRFLQQDLYTSATENLALAFDPLTASRYSLAGGNPINYVETDGHRFANDDGTASDPSGPAWNWSGVTPSPPTPASPAPTPAPGPTPAPTPTPTPAVPDPTPGPSSPPAPVPSTTTVNASNPRGVTEVGPLADGSASSFPTYNSVIDVTNGGAFVAITFVWYASWCTVHPDCGGWGIRAWNLAHGWLTAMAPNDGDDEMNVSDVLPKIEGKTQNEIPGEVKEADPTLGELRKAAGTRGGAIINGRPISQKAAQKAMKLVTAQRFRKK